MRRALRGVDRVQLPTRLLRGPRGTRLLRTAHDAGLAVDVWTVDDPGTMTELLDAGVDGIITDRPDLLRRVLDAWRPVRG